MATEFTNHTATPVGLWDTDTEHHVVAPYGGAVALEPSQSAQETIDVLVAAGAGATIDVEPPENTELPSITGTARVGEVLTGDDGEWSGTPEPVLTRQWLADDEPIEGATGTTYEPVEGDIGKVITLAVTGTNGGGESTAVSEPTAPVSPALAAPVNTTPPAITGDAELGALLTATAGEWDGSPTITYTYDWQRSPDGEDDWAAIGAIVDTYTLVEEDEGQFIRCVVTATNAAGSASENSNVIGPVVGQE